MRVDAHQHFWRYTVEEFGWINDESAAIRRDFLPGDLLPLLDQADVDSTVAVQARQSLEETNWLLDLSEENDWIAGIVGWVPLTSLRVEETLAQLTTTTKFKGVRHVLQAEPDTYMERADFNAGLATLRQFSLVYDLLVLEHQLPAAIRLVDRHPNQPFVLDHVAKPLIAGHVLEPWSKQIREIAKRPNVTCKVSGMVTEADLRNWTPQDLRPYLDTVLEAFGPGRLLFGSDWPVCTVAISYSQWKQTIAEFLAPLSPDEQDQILGHNAVNVYRLS
jgi:L-fuconolactonase